MDAQASVENRISARIDLYLAEGRLGDAVALAAASAVASSATGLMEPGILAVDVRPPSARRLYDLLRIAEIYAPGENQDLFDGMLETVVNVRRAELGRRSQDSLDEPLPELPEDLELFEEFEQYQSNTEFNLLASGAIAEGRWAQALEFEGFGPAMTPVMAQEHERIRDSVGKKKMEAIFARAQVERGATEMGGSNFSSGN